MAFGFGMGFRFGSRQGGGATVDPTLVTDESWPTIRAALGLSGTAPLAEDDAAGETWKGPNAASGNTLAKSVSSPASVDVTMVFAFPDTAATRTPFEIYNDGSNYIALACFGTSMQLLSRAAAVNQSATFASAVTGTVYLVRIQVSASVTRLTVNGTAYNATLPQVPAGLSYMAIGSRANVQPPNQGFGTEPIIAFQDNLGTVLASASGWNLSLIEALT